jgi:hypothetical protein
LLLVSILASVLTQKRRLVAALQNRIARGSAAVVKVMHRMEDE